jgi:hypothetical protein
VAEVQRAISAEGTAVAIGIRCALRFGPLTRNLLRKFRPLHKGEVGRHQLSEIAASALAGLAAAHRLGEALDEAAAFAFAIGNSEAGVTVNVSRRSETGRVMRLYFFFRRFVVFFLAARFAFFFVFFFAAIGMSIDSFDPQRCPGRATRPPKT